jgi:hypothetical protein
MRSFKTAARVSLILCLIIAGALAGNHVYSVDSHPDHYCSYGSHCQTVYVVNHPDCVGTGYPHCRSSRVFEWSKCLPDPGYSCNEHTPGYTWCLPGVCYKLTDSGWEPHPDLKACDYWLGRCTP